MDKQPSTTTQQHESASAISAGFNFRLIAVYQVIMRTGWIFKTESIIMPAALDSLGGGGWVRGCLPMLNRFGQSVPPLLIWPLVRSSSYKKRWLAVCTGLMGITFLMLAALWLNTHQLSLKSAPFLFLVCYGVFFVTTGVSQMVLSTTIGKLVPANRRGRLMLTANTLGAISAVVFAWILMRRWLTEAGGQFAYIFGFAGLCFVIASTLILRLREEPDQAEPESIHPRRLIRDAVQTFSDKRFRILALIAAMFGMSMTLFPHYQALARVRLGVGFDNLLPWLIAQNLGVALFSIPAGSLADRLGNRLVLRITLLLLCVTPIAALVISRQTQTGAIMFTFVFALLGLTPVTMRILSNFALEFAKPQDQPRYLSTLSLCMAGPAVATSTLLGWMLDKTSFEFVFVLVVACQLVGWLLTFRIVEPRND